MGDTGEGGPEHKTGPKDGEHHSRTACTLGASISEVPRVPRAYFVVGVFGATPLFEAPCRPNLKEPKPGGELRWIEVDERLSGLSDLLGTCAQQTTRTLVTFFLSSWSSSWSGFQSRALVVVVLLLGRFHFSLRFSHSLQFIVVHVLHPSSFILCSLLFSFPFSLPLPSLVRIYFRAPVPNLSSTPCFLLKHCAFLLTQQQTRPSFNIALPTSNNHQHRALTWA